MRYYRRVLVLCIALAGISHAQTPAESSLQAVSVSPRPNALGVPRTTSIAVRFNHPLSPVGGSARDFYVLGRWSGVTQGSYSLEDRGRTLRFVPSTPFSAGEMVSVFLSRNARDVFGQRLGRGYAWSFWVDSRASSANWVLAATYGAGQVPYGAYGGDLEEDGDLDLCVPNEDSADVAVYLNTGGGFAGPVFYPAGHHCSANEGADLDLDGKLDLVVENIGDDDVSVFFGNGDGTLQPQVRYAVGDEPRGLSLLDCDGDGDLDIVTGNRSSSDLSLLANRGDGTFLPQVRFEGGVQGEKSCASADMNVDGFFDLVVVGIDDDRAATSLGNGRGGFVPRWRGLVGDKPFGVATGDLDGDGANDVAVSLSGTSQAVAICLNDGTGRLGPPASYVTGPFTIAADVGDLNGDGLLDLAGSSFNGKSYTLFRNLGGGLFQNARVLPAQSAGSCTVLHDVDGDGDVDVTAIDEVADKVFVFLQGG